MCSSSANKNTCVLEYMNTMLYHFFGIKTSSLVHILGTVLLDLLKSCFVKCRTSDE